MAPERTCVPCLDVPFKLNQTAVVERHLSVVVLFGQGVNPVQRDYSLLCAQGLLLSVLGVSRVWGVEPRPLSCSVCMPAIDKTLENTFLENTFPLGNR